MYRINTIFDKDKWIAEIRQVDISSIFMHIQVVHGQGHLKTSWDVLTKNTFQIKSCGFPLMRTTDWLSCKKPNRPPSEVAIFQIAWTLFPAPLCLLCGQIGHFLPIASHPNSKRKNWRKWLHHALRSRTNYFVESRCNRSYDVKCCVLWCWTMLWGFPVAKEKK